MEIDIGMSISVDMNFLDSLVLNLSFRTRKFIFLLFILFPTVSLSYYTCIYCSPAFLMTLSEDGD